MDTLVEFFLLVAKKLGYIVSDPMDVLLYGPEVFALKFSLIARLIASFWIQDASHRYWGPGDKYRALRRD
jgi:hypothetical protein